MSNGLKNIQSHSRAYNRRNRLETGQPLNGYDDADGGLDCLTPVDDDVDPADAPYSSPETGGSTTGPHSTPGGSSNGSGASSHHAATFANLAAHHHQHQHQHQAAAGYHHQGYGAYTHHHQQQQPHHHGHGYSNSVSSTGTAGGYVAAPQQSAGGSPYLGHGARLPSVGDMGIDAIMNRQQGN